MYLFTSEIVSAGHPDKCADIISDSIVDLHINYDKNARVASEVFVAGKNVIIGGEIKSNLDVSFKEYEELVKKTLAKIGYNGKNGFSKEQCLHPDDIKVQVLLNKQSNDINQGVDKEDGEIGAGDQGIMFGFASCEASEYMPAAITYARIICNKVYEYALNNPNEFGVDIKTQVTIDYGTKQNYEECKAQKIHTIVVSAPSVESLSLEEVRAKIMSLIKDCSLPKELFNEKDCIIYINPTGRYVNHSSLHDSGLTGRKLIVDSFGGYSPIGGGAQSSKDYTKVDRSGLYAARYIAKNIVAAKLAKKCIVQLSYAIGIAKPTSINVDCMGTNTKISDDELSDFVEKHFALTPKWIKQKFSLDEPQKAGFSYAQVAALGQVGVKTYPWEQLDSVELFEKLLK